MAISPLIINHSSDKSQKINDGSDFKADVINLRDIIGQVTNTIDQIPTSPESENQKSKNY
jgi:hypothetical protein